MGITSLPSEIAAGEPFQMGLTLTNVGPVALTGTFFTTIAVEQGVNDLLLQEFLTSGPIAAGQSLNVTRSVTIPSLPTLTASFTVCADSKSQVVEANDADNCATSVALAIRRPDLRVTSIAAPGAATAGQTVTVQYAVTNEGTGTATGFSTDSIRLSTDAVVGNDRLVGVRESTQPLTVGGVSTRSVNVTLPADLDGIYRFVVEADGGNTIVETDESDNAMLAGATIDVAPSERPNLIVESVRAPTATLAGKPFVVTFTVRNIGDAPALSGWVDGVRLSSNAVLSADDAKVGTQVRAAPLQPGETYLQSVTCVAPTTPGSYVVFATADSESALLETAPAGDSDNSSAGGQIAVSGIVASVASLASEVAFGEPMPLVISASVEGTGVPAAGVPVTLRTWVRGYPSDQTVTTGADGTVTVQAQQRPSLAGIYSFGAAAPGTMPTPQAQVIVWGVQVTLDRNELVLPELGGEDGTITIRNMGDVAVTGLALASESLAPGVNLDSFLPNGSVLAPDETRIATWMASATAEAADGTLRFTVTSDQTAQTVRAMGVVIVPMEPSLVATPSPLQRTMPVGEANYASVTVRNLGTAPTGPLTVLLSTTPWLQLVSPSTLPPLQPGAETIVQVRLDPAEDLPLGPYSAAPFLVVKDSTDPTVSVGVNGVFTASSDALATVEIKARNEFSYYGVPPSYPEATVEIRRAGESALVAAGPVDSEGNASFERLEAGLYDIKVTAQGHGGFSQTRLLEPGDNEILAFLPKQLVTYQWTVVPIPFTDEYTITVSLVFETNVPAPVITVDPVILDFTAMEQPTAYREIKVKNHGLVAARDFRWEPQQTARYQIIPLFDELGDILPGQTVIAPVLMVDNAFGSDGDEDCDPPALPGFWDLICGGQENTYGITVGSRVENSCGGGGGGPGEPPLIYIPTGQGGGGGTGSPVDGVGLPVGFVGTGGGTSVQSILCDPCFQECINTIGSQGLDALASAAADAVGLGTAWGASQCFTSVAGSATFGGAIGNAIGCFEDLVPGLDSACDIADIAHACSCRKIPPPPPFLCGDEAESPFMDSDPWALPAGDSDNEVVNTVSDANNRVIRILRPRLYALGSPDFLLATAPDDVDIRNEVLSGIRAAVDPAGEDGERVSTTELAYLLSLPTPVRWDEGIVARFAERWNRSVDYRALGWFNASDVPLGFSTDFIEETRLVAFASDAQAAVAEQVARGFDNPFAELLNALNTLESELNPGQGKCVKVAVELEQTVTLVRQAFAATLALTNETETPMEGIDIDVVVKDAEGNDATDKFAFLGPSLAGLQDINGNGTLGVNATGSATWTIVPGDSAAPEGPTFYFVSGTLKYALGGEVLSIPLFPVQITVLPNASLSMQYFIATQVYGDDPFTPETEPSVPFSLGLWAKNNGGGTAEDVKVVSAQPQIVENNDGLLIDFQLIGSQVNETPVSPSLTVQMGDIVPGEVSVAQWLMISSLQGEFTGYSATIQSTNGFSDPEFAIVDEAAVNAMTHVVRADVPLDDGRPDFLGNLVPNTEDLPDRIYLSNSAVEPVTAFTDATVEQVGELAVLVTVPPEAGWIYVRIDDPYLGSRPLVEARRSDGKLLRLGDNAWQTGFIDRSTPEPEAKRRVHLFDRGGDGTYLLTFAADQTPPAISTWAVVKSHASLDEPAFNVTPAATPWSEARVGGIGLLTLSFSEPLDPATAIPSNIVVTAYAANGAEVDLDLTDREFDLRLGQQFADLRFSPALPDNLRYCIRLVGVKDLAGNLLMGDSARIDLASLPGDLTNDLRVTVNDGGALASLLGTSPIDPLNPFHVRADIDRDGSVTLTDMSLLLGQVGIDLRFVPTTCVDLDGEEPEDPGMNKLLNPTATHGPVAMADEAVGGSGGTMGANQGGSAGGGGEDAMEVEPVVIGRTGERIVRGLLRLDLLAVRMRDDGRWDESLEPVAGMVGDLPHGSAEGPAGDLGQGPAIDPVAVAAIYGLVTSLPSLDEARQAGWRFIHVPEPLWGAAAKQTLVSLLRGEGLEVAGVVARDDGTLLALTDALRLTLRRSIPLSWCERVVRRILGQSELAGAVILESPTTLFVVIDLVETDALTESIRLLSARREFEEVVPLVVPLGVPLRDDGEDSDPVVPQTVEEVAP